MLATSMWTAASGLLAHQRNIDVIGNNIANSNTTGFKKSAQSFVDVLQNTLRGSMPEENARGAVDPLQIGLGVRTGAITQTFTQGGLNTTGRQLDLAIEGDSFFVMQKGGTAQNLYTRDGAFYLDPGEHPDGRKRLLGGNGMSVMGWNAVDGVLPGGGLQPVAIPLGQTLAGRATSEITFEGNLDARGSVVQANVIPTSVAGPGWLSNTGLPIQVGHVQTSQALWSKSTGLPATANLDLADLQYSTPGVGTGRTDFFTNLVNGDAITLNFKKTEESHTATFLYGQTGTTLGDFSTWMAGGLGDAGTPTSERLTGGVFGTVRTQQQTVIPGGFDAPAEQAGAFLRDEGGEMLLSIASNLGAMSAVTGFEFIHNGRRVNDAFHADPQYGAIPQGGSAAIRETIHVPGAPGGVRPLETQTHFALVSRDNNGSTWRWMLDGGGDQNNLGTGLVRFDTQGRVVGEIQDTPGTIRMQMPGLHQFATNNNLVLADQDGYPEGVMEDFNIDLYGVVTGRYTNGVNRVEARIALASIPNAAGMLHLGDNLWTESVASGVGLINTDPNAGGFGRIRASTLESSNVDLATEMTSLIYTQRGWQANSKIITTTDEMLQELVRLKR